MFKIINKTQLSQNVFRFEVVAPQIAKNRRAGHFVILRVNEGGERIPLTIVDSDKEKGIISIIVQKVGVSSHKLCNLKIGDVIADLVGPLGHATEIEYKGTVLAAGGGVGLAPLLPIVKAMKNAGNKIITVMAARSKELLILEDEFKKCSDEILIVTNDGSAGIQGIVTDGIKLVAEREKIDFAVAIGPAIMMKFVSLLTKELAIPTIASLNTIMVDGTGMCGACRVSVGGKVKFVCVDGPEFDAHLVDFDEMIYRLDAYKDIEKEAYSSFENTCK